MLSAKVWQLVFIAHIYFSLGIKKIITTFSLTFGLKCFYILLGYIIRAGTYKGLGFIWKNLVFFIQKNEQHPQSAQTNQNGGAIRFRYWWRVLNLARRFSTHSFERVRKKFKSLSSRTMVSINIVDGILFHISYTPIFL